MSTRHLRPIIGWATFTLIAVSGCREPVPSTAAPPVASSSTPAPALASAPTSVATPSSTSAQAGVPSAPSLAQGRPDDPPDHAPDEAGGPCTYAEQTGMCTVQAGKVFTFAGKIDGKAVTLKNNPLREGDPPLAVGKAVPCALRFETAGTCAPCVFSIGSCGEAALAAFRAHR